VEPSVLALNMTGVSLALMQFMQVTLGITCRTPRDLKFSFLSGNWTKAISVPAPIARLSSTWDEAIP